MARALRLPLPGSHEDLTRKGVLGGIADARAAGRGGRGGASIAEVRRFAELRGSRPSYATVHKYGGQAFARTPSGRYRLKASDTIPRREDLILESGEVQLGSTVRGSRDASKVGRWQVAAGRYLRTGDDAALRRLSEKDRTLSEGRVLAGDPDVIQEAADADRLERFREESGS
jgi:hypothetical protein